MKLENKNLIVKRAYKEVYKTEEGIVKIFEKTHPKADVFNEALNTARVEAAGLRIPGVKEVAQIDGKWALLVEYQPGKTLEELMEELPENLDAYMEEFVDLQLEMHGKTSPHRLESMPKHVKLCHGDFNPSNVICSDDGKKTIVDWAHATQGNASADAAMTYLLFALKDQKKADLYLKIFCRKSDTARQYVEQWLPIVAAAQLTKNNELEKEFLMRWIDVVDFS